MKRYCLIANPNAGKLRKVPLLAGVRTLLDKAGVEHDLKTTDAPGLGITLALEAAPADLQARTIEAAIIKMATPAANVA